MLLLRALGGSRLYGTSHPDSDWDWYEVHDHIEKSQVKIDGQDTTKMPLTEWLLNCEKGTHQALDALWCPASLCEVDLIEAFRWNFRIDPWRVHAQLIKTTTSPQHTTPRHTPRLLHYAERILEQGFYDPTEWGRIN